MNSHYLKIVNKSDRTIKSSRLKNKETEIKHIYNSEFPIRYNQLGNNNSNRKPKDKLRMKEQYQEMSIGNENLSAEKYQEYMDNIFAHDNSTEDHVFNEIIIPSHDQKLKGNFKSQQKMYKQELKKIHEYSNQNSQRSSGYRQKNPKSHLQKYHIKTIYDTNEEIEDKYLEGKEYKEKDSRRVQTDIDFHHSPQKDYFDKK